MSCLLCSSPLSSLQHSNQEQEGFCCKGCAVVYQILKAQGLAESFQEHPLYKQAQQAGWISRPYLPPSKEEEKKIDADDFQKLYLTIQNMWCPSCAQILYFVLMREKGVRHCAIDYATDLSLIEYTPRFISKERLIRLIKQWGYLPQSLEDPRQKAIDRSLLLRFVVAAFFSLNIMMFSYPIYAAYFDGHTEGYADLFAWLSFAASLPVLFYSAYPIWHRCYTGLKVGIWGMETLVSLGVGAATLLSLYELGRGSSFVYFDSMTVILLFVLLGKIIESKAKFSAKEALFKLSLSLPRRGRKRFSTGEERFVPIKEFQPGELLVVQTGEKVVLDGVVQHGTGACDESHLTGEVLPVGKEVGSSLLAGSLLQQGTLVVKVTTSLEESTLHRLVQMVGQEVEHKSRYVRAADKIAKGFVPFVLALAFSVACYCLWEGLSDPGQTPMQTAFTRAISILLISCPCAIGIAAPLSESYVLNTLAQLGVIVRNPGCLSFLGKETFFVFDKTGTVTEGKFRICSGLEVLNEEEQQALKGLTARSLHPIAMAIYQHLSCPTPAFEKIEEKIGQGLQGVWKGKTYFLGSASFLTQAGIPLLFLEPHDPNSFLTLVYFAEDKQCLAPLYLGDALRPDIRAFIETLPPIKAALLSGDSARSVAKVAHACQILRWKAECHPLEKRMFIEQLKKEGEIVAMLGDGINDAPALTAAHVGIAVLSANDISAQAADLLLTTSRFSVLSQLRQVARKGRKIMKQNLFWAFFYNGIGLGLAATGRLTPLFAACAMVLSSLMILFNTQRISYTRKLNG